MNVKFFFSGCRRLPLCGGVNSHGSSHLHHLIGSCKFADQLVGRHFDDKLERRRRCRRTIFLIIIEIYCDAENTRAIAGFCADIRRLDLQNGLNSEKNASRNEFSSWHSLARNSSFQCLTSPALI